VSALAIGHDVDLAAELQRLSRARIFFAHRSVGADLLDGIRALAADEGDTSVRVLETEDDLPEGVFGHALLSDNGDPLGKLRRFERMLAAGVGPVADIVIFKFCYSDISSRTDVPWLFRTYDRMIRAQRDAYPGAKFVHVTTPLTVVPAGARAAVSGLFGRVPEALADNARREEFNGLMRRAYAGTEPLFDLAGAESIAPSGARELHDLHGRPIAALVPAYTSDGGHLNPFARTRIARELIALLASLVERA